MPPKERNKLLVILLLVNVVLGIVIIPIGLFSYFAIGFGEMPMSCLYLDILPFGLACGAFGLYCTKRFPRLFWLFPIVFSGPAVFGSILWALMDYSESTEPGYFIIPFVPVGMLFLGLIMCLGGYLWWKGVDWGE
jgi:hypothetical protein